MNSIPMLSSILGLSFASGVNLYAAVLMVGLGLRFHWIGGLPGDLAVLASPLILSAAAILYFMEFFADKIPYVSVAWDSIHTFVRPVGAAALALASAAKLSPELQALAMLLGGSVALGTHSTKMGYRLIAHASPEPVSDSIFSMAEDFGVVGLVLLTYRHPAIALGVVGGLLVLVAVALPFLFRILAFVASGVLGRMQSWFSTSSQAAAPPAWLQTELQGRPGAEYCRVYSRRLPSVPRMQQGYLVRNAPGEWFAYRGWFKPRMVSLEGGAAQVQRGLLFNLLLAQNWSLYMTKDCAAHAWYPGGAGNGPRASSSRMASFKSASSL